MRRILLLEPYDGGSHARFLDDLIRQFPADQFERISLPARAWKWRMRFGAIEFARRLRDSSIARGDFDFILASTFLNLAEFRALAPPSVATLPALLYFHENQLAYPNQVKAERDNHFGITNLISALAANTLVFNTAFNRDRFFAEIPSVTRPAPDMDLEWVVAELKRKTRVMPVPLDLDREPSQPNPRPRDQAPIVVWNHRWEHDKNPEPFFSALKDLAARGLEFRVAVAGQDFDRRPVIFDEARRGLGSRICQWGSLDDRGQYIDLLRRSSVCVSTANHEFQGLSVLEAAAQGCHLVLPNRLSYPELFPHLDLYRNQSELSEQLAALLLNRTPVDAQLVARAQEYSWTAWRSSYDTLFTDLVRS